MEPWTAPRVELTGEGDWIAHEATIWRTVSLFQPALPDPGVEAGLGALLSVWLQEMGPAATLRVVIQVGGSAQPAAWLGISWRALQRADAVAGVRDAAADISPLLGTWRLFQAGLASTPPRLGGLKLQLTEAPGWEGDLLSSFGQDRSACLPAALHRVAGLPGRIALRVALTPTYGDPEHIASSVRALRKAMATAVEDYGSERSLPQRATALYADMTSVWLDATLEGAPPLGRAVRIWLAQSWSEELGSDLVFREGAGPVKIQRGHLMRTLEALTLATPGERAGQTDPRAFRDLIP